MDASSEPSTERLERGFNWRTVLALLFAAFALLPVSLYLQLVSGVVVASAAVYITAILFTEIARMLGAPLTKHETYIIFMVSSIAAGLSIPFLSRVQTVYFMTSPIAWAFRIGGSPLPTLAPTWWAPPLGSTAYLTRSLLHQDWILPTAVGITIGGVLWIIQEIALTLICSVLYIEIEPLAFPFAKVNAEICETLAERDPRKMRVFILSALVGLTYAMIIYGIPTLSQGIFNIPFTLIPVPWVDMTTGLFGIDKILPGAIFGVATDLLPYVSAFVVPFHILVTIFIASIAVWVFGNHLALTALSSFFPEWKKEWMLGMDFALTWQRSQIRVWLSPQISFALAAAAIYLVKAAPYMVRAFKTLLRLPTTMQRAGYLRLPTLLAMYFGATGLSVLIFHLLVPDFPVWVPILASMGWGFMGAILSVRAVGDTGYSISVPYVWQGSVFLTGYEGVGPWLISPAISGGTWTSQLKVAYLTNTNPKDFFKAYVVAVVLYHIASFVYISFFWSVAPIPSSVYPYTLIAWPVEVLNTSMWMTRQIGINPTVMIGSFALMLSLGMAGEALAKFVQIPFSLVAVVTGTTTLPPAATALLIGGLVAKVLRRYFSVDWWTQYRAVIVAGAYCGEGIVVGVAAAAVMIAKATWVKPF